MAEFKISVPIEMQYRQCYVDGKKAIFHKWEKKKTPIIKFNRYYSDEQLAVEIEKVILDARTNIYFQESDYGIVEYEDGTVAEVEPSKIKFVTGIMEEYLFDEFKYLYKNLTSCNDCAYNGHPELTKHWKYCPKIGEHVRYNCPYWKGIEE